MKTLPAGIVTFMLTDVEGSTRLWQERKEWMRTALKAHDDLIAAIVTANRGVLIKSRGEGDSSFSVFATASDALVAAGGMQRMLLAGEGSLKVRIVLHTGEAEVRQGDYFGTTVNRCARLRAIGHGGQILLSHATRELVRDTLPEGYSLRDLGEHGLRDFAGEERVFQLMHDELPSSFPPLNSSRRVWNNLPPQLSRFIGRQTELEELRRLLSEHRLVTLTASGGAGKTRLALHLAAELVDLYPAGVWFVDLSALTEPERVAQEVATVLSLRESAGQSYVKAVIGHFGPTRPLLILDNCEHLVDACASMVTEMLRACAGMRVIATSREALGVSGEVAWRVPSMSLPAQAERAPMADIVRSEAVMLFSDRAALSSPGFTVNPDNAVAVMEVCRRLDGIPLAIELAAARLRYLSLQQITDRLDDRLRLLSAGSRTASARQRTLRATIEWSYDLLDQREAMMFERLSVFAGSFSLESAEAVTASEGIEAADVLDFVATLVDKSLVTVEAAADRRAYRLLETLREYGRERLAARGDLEEFRRKHAEHFTAMAEGAEEAMIGKDQPAVLTKLNDELDNIRIALDWAKDSDPDIGLRLSVALIRFWAGRSYYAEGIKWLTLFVGASEAASATRIKALTGIGRLAQELGDFVTGSEANSEALRQAQASGDALSAASANNNLGILAKHHGDYEGSSRFFEASLTALREVGTPGQVTKVLTNLANLYFVQADFVRAQSIQVECLAFQRAHGDLTAVAIALGNLAEIVLWSGGDLDEAARLAEEGLNTSRELGDLQGEALALSTLGNIAHRRGAFDESAEQLGRSLVILRDQGLKPDIAAGLESLAALAVSRDKAEEALRLAGAAAALRDALQERIAPVYKREVEATLATARMAVTSAKAEQAWREGREMALDTAIDAALSALGTND